MTKIMVVDDEMDTVELVKIILKKAGFETLAFVDPEIAFSELKRGANPDLLILDVRMPKMSGFDFCKKMREDPVLKKIKVVFFTASADFCKDMIVKYGVEGSIFKPFDNDDLVNNIKKYIAKPRNL